MPIYIHIRISLPSWVYSTHCYCLLINTRLWNVSARNTAFVVLRALHVRIFHFNVRIPSSYHIKIVQYLIKISLINKFALKNDGPQILSGPPGTVPGVPPLNTSLTSRISYYHNVCIYEYIRVDSRYAYYHLYSSIYSPRK